MNVSEVCSDKQSRYWEHVCDERVESVGVKGRLRERTIHND